MLVKMETSSIGGGGVLNFTQVYKNGVWDNTLKSLIKTYGVTENTSYLSVGNTQGSGIYINTDESANYDLLVVVATENTAAYRQWGVCNTGSTLPTIITSGSGRGGYLYNSTNEKICYAQILSGKGVFCGSSTTNNPFNIAEIYLAKKV